MKIFLIRTALCCMLLLASLVSGTGVASAAPCASPSSQAASCVLDQQQLASVGADVFGGAVVRGQTFVPAFRTRVCKVSVKIAKNNPHAGNLTLHILRDNFVVLQSATILAGAIPPGPSVQTFTFGCNGPGLPLAPFYGLKLTSPTSPLGAYAWFHGLNEAAYPVGQGWVNAGAGWAPAGHDYVFKIYTCR